MFLVCGAVYLGRGAARFENLKPPSLTYIGIFTSGIKFKAHTYTRAREFPSVVVYYAPETRAY